MLRYHLILCLVYCHNSYFSVEKDETTDDKVKRESGDSDGSDSDSDDDADVSKVCMISYKSLPG